MLAWFRDLIPGVSSGAWSRDVLKATFHNSLPHASVLSALSSTMFPEPWVKVARDALLGRALKSLILSTLRSEESLH